MKILVLAGGFATRLWPITEHRAKPLLLVNGQTILHHLLEKLKNIDPRDIIILTNQKFEQDFREALVKFGNEQSQIFIEDAKNEGAKLGALKAVSCCIEHFNIQENIAILAGDNLLTDFEIEHLQVKENQACILVREVESLYEARKFGVVEMDGHNRVTSFEEKPEHPKSKLVSTGFMSLGQKLFPLLKDFTKAHPDNLGGLFAHMVESGQNKDFEILCHESKGDWFDIGSFETYLQAHTHLQKQTLLEGQNIKQSENTFSGKVSIADNCQVHNCVIIDSIIYPGVVLENCRISRCIIDEKTRLSGVDLNHKIIRRNTELKSGLDPQV